MEKTRLNALSFVFTNRQNLTSISSACYPCMFATVAGVCGANCLKQHFHLAFPAGSVVVTIGSSNKNPIKSATIPAGYICPSVVSKANWVGSDTYGDTFEIAQSGTILSAKRTDTEEGWGMNLRIRCAEESPGSHLASQTMHTCLPSLAARLQKEQAAELNHAIDHTEPFGLSMEGSGLQPADLYLPSSETLFGTAVYVGLDTNHRAFRCNPSSHPQTFTISNSSDSSQCDGFMLISLDTGTALNPADGTRLPFVLHSGLGKCAQALQSAPLFKDRMAFGRSTTTLTVACLLTRWF